MANRQPVDSGLGPAPFRPVAGPVSRFVQPTDGRKIAQIAAGLAQFSPALMGLAQVRGQQEDAEAKQEGEAEARRLFEEGMSYKKAIEKGLISPDQSPWFRLGAKEFFGRNAATAYRDFLQTQLDKSPVADSTEIADFDKFEQEKRQEFVEQFIGKDNRDPAFEAAFGRGVDAAVSGVRAQFAQGAGQRLIKQTGDAIHQSIMQTALDAHTGHTSTVDAAAAIQVDIDRAIIMGMVDKGKVNRMAALGIINAAKKANDPELLKILDHITTGPGGILANVPEVAEAVEQAENQIAQQNRVNEAAARQSKELERQEKARDLGTSLVTDMIQADNPLKIPNFTERITEIAKYDEGYARSLFGARSALAHAKIINDPSVVNDLVLGVYRGEVDERDVVDALAAGEIDVNGLSQVMNHIQSLRNAGSGGGKPGQNAAFDADAFKQAQTTLTRNLGVNLMGLGDLDPTNPKEKRAQDALGFLRREWFRYWSTGGADQPWTEQDKFLTGMVDTLVSRFQSNISNPTQETPEGPGATFDPLWKRRPVVPYQTLGAIEGQLNRRGIRGLTPNAAKTLQLLQVEFTGDRVKDEQAAREALEQQRFLLDLRRQHP